MYQDLITIKEKVAHIEGVSVIDLVTNYQTPLICYNQTMLEKNICVFKDNFVSSMFDTQVLYASKAFSVKALYQLLAKYQLGIDVVSGGEIFTALQAGYDLNNAFFHGNNKSKEELLLAIDHNIGCIVLDNVNEINLLEEILAEKNKPVKVMIRVNPGINAHTHSYIQTAKLTSKFGISIFDEEELVRFINRVKSVKNIEFMGLHAHIGSQIFDKKAHVKVAKALITLMKSLHDKYEINFKWLNLGGGFGISINRHDQPYDIKQILTDLIINVEKLLKKNQLMLEKLFIEPGRSIVSECACTLYTIGGIKTTFAKKKYLFIDGGMNDNIRPALYNALYECDIANKIGEEKSEICTIAGKNCESGDILINDIAIQKAQINDLLIVYSTGAYTYSMSSNYNKNLKPAVVFIKDQKISLVVKRETYNDLIINENDLG